jgi:hypothetical protein
MGFDNVIRDGIGVIDSVTGTLQVDVIHRAWIGNDTSGEAQFATDTVHKAIVEYKRRLVKTATGEIVQQQAMVLFPRVIAPNGAEKRREPIDPRDEIELPDGHIGPIISVVGPPTDPNTNRPYMLEVALG